MSIRAHEFPRVHLERGDRRVMAVEMLNGAVLLPPVEDTDLIVVKGDEKFVHGTSLCPNRTYTSGQGRVIGREKVESRAL